MKNFFSKNFNVMILGIVIICSVFLLFQELNRDKNPKIIFLDVGQGDSTLIITPNGRKILVDAGKYSSISEKISNHIGFLDRSIDMVIATHPDSDHVTGFNTLIDEYDIGYFVHSGLLAGSPIYRTIASKVRDKNVSTITAYAGEIIEVDTNMFIEILSPYLNQKIDEPNNHSVVVKINYLDTSILLTGDASIIVEQNLVSLYGERLQSDILKLGHHGSKTSTSSNFVQTVQPEYGIISAGCNNTFGHPHAAVLRTLDDYGVTDISTCEQGDIVFEFKEGDWILEK